MHKLPKLWDAWEKFQEQQGRSLAESEPFGFNIMGGSFLKEKNYVFYKSLVIYPHTYLQNQDYTES